MPNISLTHDEINCLAAAMGAAVASAQRQQKSGKNPQITEVYRTLEGNLKELEAKLIKAGSTKQP